MENNNVSNIKSESTSNYFNSSNIKTAKLLMEQEHKDMMQKSVKLPQALLETCILDQRANNRFKYFGGAVNVIELVYFLYLPISLLNLFALAHCLIGYQENVVQHSNFFQWPYLAVFLFGVVHILALNGLYVRVKYLLLPYLTIYAVLLALSVMILFQSFVVLIGCLKTSQYVHSEEEETDFECGLTKRNKQNTILSLVLLPNLFAYKYVRECYVFICQRKEEDKIIFVKNTK